MLTIRAGGLRTFNPKFIKGMNWRRINETPLKRVGLLVRKIMRGSIRRDTSKSRRPSKPGRPPKSRAPGHPFKRIYSIPDMINTSVVIGHVGYRGGQTAMEMHEFGQQVTKKVYAKPRRKPVSSRQRSAARRKFLQGKIKPKPRPTIFKRIKMPARPFAAPALKKAKPKIAQFWRGSFNRGTVRNR